jgi:hypothetical protein
MVVFSVASLLHRCVYLAAAKPVPCDSEQRFCLFLKRFSLLSTKLVAFTTQRKAKFCNKGNKGKRP